MILATYNVESLFQRAKIMNLPTWSEGRAVLEDYALLTDLINQEEYTEDDKAEMLKIAGRNRGLFTNGESKFITFREIRGKLIKKHANGPVEIVANGRAEWVGWFELKPEPVKDTAIENVARIVRDLKADVLCVIEAENRISLKRFNEMVIPKIGGTPFEHVMLIEGNDYRGIDVGILARGNYAIGSVVSHVDDADDEGMIFSRDCPEYTINTPSGKKLLIMVNHFKSKGYGKSDESNKKRRRQAERVRSIYEERLLQGYEYIAIAGDFNDTPDSDALAPLIQENSTLQDAMSLSQFVGDGRPGTFANGARSQKIDYLLLSSNLTGITSSAGLDRRGVWGGKDGTLFEHLAEIKKPVDAASDHAALWVEINL